MRRQMATFDDGERKRLFDEVQSISPSTCRRSSFVAPRVFVAVSTRVTNLMPTAFLAAAAAVDAGHPRRRAFEDVTLRTSVAPDTGAIKQPQRRMLRRQ